MPRQREDRLLQHEAILFKYRRAGTYAGAMDIWLEILAARKSRSRISPMR